MITSSDIRVRVFAWFTQHREKVNSNTRSSNLITAECKCWVKLSYSALGPCVSGVHILDYMDKLSKIIVEYQKLLSSEKSTNQANAIAFFLSQNESKSSWSFCTL
jgi:hypothetical protein